MAHVTVFALGDNNARVIRQRVDDLLPGEWKVSVTGSQANDTLEIKIASPDGKSSWILKSDATVDDVLVELERFVELLNAPKS